MKTAKHVMDVIKARIRQAWTNGCNKNSNIKQHTWLPRAVKDVEPHVSTEKGNGYRYHKTREGPQQHDQVHGKETPAPEQALVEKQESVAAVASEVLVDSSIKHEVK